ncbi:unnamed protein product [Linum trigynum]|uniref:BRCT domain-containing protein n=1 Tax=Linum trigynum TaxID=586398 RepID=A0AAV2FFM0_9ROSI
MVSIGDDGGGAVRPADDYSSADFPAGDTQPLDSQRFPPSSPGKKGGYDDDDDNDLYTETRKVSFDDTVPVEDVFETQVVNYGGETQVLDDDDLDFLGSTSTQRIDECSDQVSLDSDGEGTDTTEVLESNDELSDDEFGRGGKLEELMGEKCVNQANALCNQKPSSESVPLSSEHIASGNNILRISGCNETIWESKTGQNISQEKELENGTKSKVDSSIVRRLFSTDSVAKDGDICHPSSIPGGVEEIARSTIDDEFSRLSYIDSQEPGDASQADALAVVERLIEETKSSFDFEVNLGNTCGRISDCVSAAKGPQSLAQKTLKRSIQVEAGIFDWDDGLEDEGGGDIFIRRKDDFLGVRSLSTNPKGRLNPQKGNRGNFEVENKVTTVQSDSKLVVQKFKVPESKTRRIPKNTRKDLLNEFHDQANRKKPTGPPEDIAFDPEFPDVGLGTQLAAEAMEELLNGDPVPDFDGNDAKENHSVQQSPIRIAKRLVSSKRRASCDTSEIRVDTRQSKKRKTQSKVADAMESKEEQGSPIRKAKRIVSSKKCAPKDHYDIGVRTRQSKKRKTQLAGDTPETLDVGLDTQLAADAMEALLNGDPISDCDGKDGKEEHSLQHSPIRKAERRASSKQFASDDNSDIGVDTRKSNIRKKNNAKKVNLECDAGPVMMTRRRVKSHAAEGSSSCGQKTMEKLPSRTRAPESKGAALRRGRSAKNYHSPEEHADHTTIAHQSSKSNLVSLLETADSRHADVSEDKDGAWEEVCGHEQTPAEALNSGGKTSELTSSKPTKPNRLQSKLTALTHDISFPRKRRSERNFLEQPKGKESNDEARAKFAKSSDGDTDSTLLAEKEVNVVTPDKLLRGIVSPPSVSAAASPLGSLTTTNTTTTNAASPICMGNGLSKKKLDTSSMKREINSLFSMDPEPISEEKGSRKRRDLADIRVLFSHHLNENVIKRQKKIVDRLKVPIASSILDATHFVTDRFVRTRNMLESIAAGKPVVTPLWLEHIGRAKCYIDEQKYIMKDVKKEKEIGFNMAASLEHARQHQLLQGRKVLITQNAKPSQEIVSSLVKAAHGQPIERVGRSALKDDTLIDDLLVLSCDEDYEVCIPFLERGAAVYGSELLLNGIVTRKLEYDRHRLFLDHVKRTRSTIWVKKDGHSFTPVVKNK